MASDDATLFDPELTADRLISDYIAHASEGDVLRAEGVGSEAWRALFAELATISGDSLQHARERAQRHAAEIGTGFRIAGEREGEERAWPLSPIPLLIAQKEWARIAEGVSDRAERIEQILADIYGDARLISDGQLPATLVTGSPYFLRPMSRLHLPGGHHLQFIAFDLGRAPDGEWRVLADHLRAPAGAGYALENRLAMARTLGGLPKRLKIERQAGFFAAFREGLAASCRRAEPRMALLTPGKLNPSYAEQAHLARYLGFLLVEGGDLTVLDDKVYVRTIAGLKRIDALWHRLDPRLLDPLALDSYSSIGVPGLIDALAQSNVVMANAPGAGVAETPAFLSVLPRLSTAMGAPLKLRSVESWWCGDADSCQHVLQNLDQMLIVPAFGVRPLGLSTNKPVLGANLSPESRATLVEDMQRRPQDYVGQEVMRLSTMPAVGDDLISARPFTVRVFAARDAKGEWVVLPGGFARIGAQRDVRAAVMGEGEWSADVVVHGVDVGSPITLLPDGDAIALRRNPGTLPSRAADNLFWLGRYLERGEALLSVLRVLLGNSISADTGAALADETVEKLVELIGRDSGAPLPKSMRRADLQQFVRAMLEDDGPYSVRGINLQAKRIGQVSRDRLSADMAQLLDAPFPTKGSMLERAGTLLRRYTALLGFSAEHMARTDGWRFHDVGRRLERSLAAVRTIRAFGIGDASGDDLSTLLDLADSQITYRQRYLTGLARVPVMDLVMLDPFNPRSVAFQIGKLSAHLNKLPVLSDTGVAELQQEQARDLAAILVTTRANRIDATMLQDLENRLSQLSHEIGRRYFLHGAEELREAGMILA